MADRVKRRARQALARLRTRRVDRSKVVPGPFPDAASNIVAADVAIRMGSFLMRRAVERGFLKGRYGRDNARAIIANRTIGQTLVSEAIARLATGSLPGGVLVTTGLVGKLLLERSRKRRLVEAEGDAELLDQARD